jgi:hypothetical protein
MSVGIGNEAAQLPFLEYKNWILFAVQALLGGIYYLNS